MLAILRNIPFLKRKSAIPEDLEPHAAMLRRMIGSTEQEFLMIGEKLQEFHCRANDISGWASDVAEKISGPEMNNVRAGFESMSSLVDRLSGGMQSEKESIRLILSHFKGLGQPLEEFEKVVRILNVLCNFIKIEIAHLALSDTSFFKLSQDVRQMAQVIGNKITSLSEQAEAAVPALQKNAALMEESKARQHEQSRQILENVRASLSAISAKHDESVLTIQEIRDTWKHLSDHIGEVVLSLQFHDITRQRLEHVVEALDELPRKVRELAAGKRAVRKGGTSALPLFSLRRRELVAHTFELQAAQLQSARQDMTDAVERVFTNLRLVARDAAAISEKIYAAAGRTNDRNSESFLIGLEKGIDSLAGSADEMIRIRKDLAQAMSVMSQTAEGMSVFAKDMQVIGVEMQRLALNARVHAAHLGDEGATLGVLADSIHQMSQDTTSKVSNVTVHLQAVVENAASLAGMACAQGVESESGQDNIRAQFLGLSAPLKEMEAAIGKQLARVEEFGKKLSSDIEALLASVQMHESLGADMEKVESYLRAQAGRLNIGRKEDLSQQKARMLADLSSRYTMQRERKTHSASVGASAAQPKSASGDVPRSQETKPAAIEGAEKPAEDDLGDNVELF